MSNKYNGSFNFIAKHKILPNVFIVVISFILNFVNHVADESFNNVLVDVEDNLSLTLIFGNKMQFDSVLEYDKHIGEKLIAFIIGMDHIIFQPFHLMLGAHIVFNIVIMERGRPSLHFSHGLVLGTNFPFSTKCNTETTL